MDEIYRAQVFQLVMKSDGMMEFGIHHHMFACFLHICINLNNELFMNNTT